MSCATDYQAFLQRKVVTAKDAGFDISLDEINPALKPHTRVIVQWMVKGGRRALFASFGLLSKMYSNAYIKTKSEAELSPLWSRILPLAVSDGSRSWSILFSQMFSTWAAPRPDFVLRPLRQSILPAPCRVRRQESVLLGSVLQLLAAAEYVGRHLSNGGCRSYSPDSSGIGFGASAASWRSRAPFGFEPTQQRLLKPCCFSKSGDARSLSCWRNA